MNKILEYPCVIWHRISDYIPDVKPNYWISTSSAIYNESANKFLTAYQNKYGYYEIQLRSNKNTSITFRFHRLLMMCFRPHPNQDNLDVNHRNGNKYDNYLWNLEWCTRSENLKHASSIGLRRSGERTHTCRYSEDLVRKVCICLSNRMTPKDICNHLGLNYDNENDRHFISRIANGESWTGISCLYNIPETNRTSQIFVNEEIRYICKCIINNISGPDILKNLNIDKDEIGQKMYNNMLNLISKIRKKKRFTNISNEFF